MELPPNSIGSMWAGQADLDEQNAMSVPLLEYDTELVALDGELVPLTLGRYISRDASTVAFESLDPPGLTITYKCDCAASGSIHPLVRAYRFMIDLRGSALTPTPLCLSPAVLLGDSVTSKTDFVMTSSARAGWVGNRGTVWYMVTQMTSYSLPEASRLFGFSLRAVVYLTRELVCNLRQMHRTSGWYDSKTRSLFRSWRV